MANSLMENGDVALDIGIEELALDRPPCSLSACEDIFKDVENTDIDYEAIGSSRLASCLIDKPLNYPDETFDPPSSSEKKFEPESISDSPPLDLTHDDDPDSDIVEIHSSQLPVAPTEIHVVSSSTPLSIQLQDALEYKPVGKKQTNRYTHTKQKLVSCLKTDDNNEINKVKMKCVHFNDSSGIVTEFIEAVNPWKDMRTPSKAEVVSFYKNVCQKMKCKPLDKAIKQIQDAPDLSTRSGTLVLRGCRLDNRSCEALESVFKRVQFENLDLENCSLEEDGATSILEMIEFYHSTCKLNIACNPKIGLRGWQSLCRMLRKTPCLTYLDARRTILTEMTMPTFGRCLKADPYLKVLHLEGVFLSGRPLLILTTALKYNRLLEELYLGDNDLTSSDGPCLGAMLTYNTTLQLLDLRNNQIKDIGLAHIGNGLSDQSEQPCGGLCSLIMWNNGLTHEGMSYMCEGLVKTTTLKALNLGQNRIGDLGVQKLKPGLIKNKSLRKLGFLNTKLGSEGGVALAEVLADSWSITRIDIRENCIQTAGLMAFAMALKVNQSLLRLDLDKDIKKEPGMETVMQSVLVDIYNLCHRNKQLLRRNITSSPSSSTNSMAISISRQSSTSSEMNEPFISDDVFHPEVSTQEITPFSPVTASNENPMDILDVNHTIKKETPNKDIGLADHDCNSSTESLGNSINPVFETIKRGRAYSHPISKNPDPGINERRARFSVTKILDSLGTHAAGVANKFAQMDSKLKKQSSRDKIDNKSSELMPVLEQNQPIDLDQFKAATETTNENEGNTDTILLNKDTAIFRKVILEEQITNNHTGSNNTKSDGDILEKERVTKDVIIPSSDVANVCNEEKYVIPNKLTLGEGLVRNDVVPGVLNHGLKKGGTLGVLNRGTLGSATLNDQVTCNSDTLNVSVENESSSGVLINENNNICNNEKVTQENNVIAEKDDDTYVILKTDKAANLLSTNDNLVEVSSLQINKTENLLKTIDDTVVSSSQTEFTESSSFNILKTKTILPDIADNGSNNTNEPPNEKQSMTVSCVKETDKNLHDKNENISSIDNSSSNSIGVATKVEYTDKFICGSEKAELFKEYPTELTSSNKTESSTNVVSSLIHNEQFTRTTECNNIDEFGNIHQGKQYDHLEYHGNAVNTETSLNHLTDNIQCDNSEVSNKLINQCDDYVPDVNVLESQSKGNLVNMKMLPTKGKNPINKNLDGVPNDLGIEYDGSIKDHLKDLNSPGEYISPVVVGHSVALDLPT